jgi:hypothetical protein
VALHLFRLLDLDRWFDVVDAAAVDEPHAEP